MFEDEAVAIMERPTIGGDARLARILAENHLRMASEDASLPRTELLRQVAKRIRRLSAIRTLGALNDDQLEALIRETADVALAALRETRELRRSAAGHVDV